MRKKRNGAVLLSILISFFAVREQPESPMPSLVVRPFSNEWTDTHSVAKARNHSLLRRQLVTHETVLGGNSAEQCVYFPDPISENKMAALKIVAGIHVKRAV